MLDRLDDTHMDPFGSVDAGIRKGGVGGSGEWV